MKALIISDIHSNIVALEAIWKREKDSDVIYCAGDLVDYGPYPKEVIAWVREHRVICVKGNHDEKVVRLYRRQEELWSVADEERTWAHDNAQKLDEDDIAFLDGLPESVTFSIASTGYSMQHMYRDYETIQSLHAYREFWERQTKEPIRSMPEKRLIFGHTHRRCVHYLSDDELWMNPGSVSYRRPDDPCKQAHYITITDGKIELKGINYDRSTLLQATLNTPLKYQGEREVALFFFG
jgi:putative phosphoesterase